jgi:hypothetical protein
MRCSGGFAIVGVLAVAAGCGGGVSSPSVTATCPPPPLRPTPIPAWLAYPPNGSTNVATTIGEIIEKGADAPGQGLAVTVASSSGRVALGAPAVVPSPYPTPFATAPPTFGIIAPYMAIPLPALAPSTTYTVDDVYMDWANNPPKCSAQYTQHVGTFTTGQ